MNKEDEKMLFAVLSAFEKYNKCVQEQCKTHVDALKRATVSHQERINKLHEKMMKQNISFEKFTKEFAAIQEDIQKLEETKHLNTCSLSKCKESLIALLDTSIKAMSANSDKKTKKTVEQIKLIREKVKKDRVTSLDYERLMRLIKK